MATFLAQSAAVLVPATYMTPFELNTPLGSAYARSRPCTSESLEPPASHSVVIVAAVCALTAESLCMALSTSAGAVGTALIA